MSAVAFCPCAVAAMLVTALPPLTVPPAGTARLACQECIQHAQALSDTGCTRTRGASQGNNRDLQGSSATWDSKLNECGLYCVPLHVPHHHSAC